ncbi:hypothetical protein I3843_16G025100 [Carya illinoinensis]|uniref:PGG domain-containing protein n=1 Tax=Carya illinoinensis TaxID=32201 RepID=A0A922D8B2_CARIL|nr:hypothetical protein I3842_16G022200 [Carya illinoinensis]KAG7941159.1 hypothetical protein I3843_16G025100 [Carya illinoinensis]
MEEGDISLSDQSPAFYAPLLRAILEDDWTAAEAFIQKHQNCLGVAITKDQYTALHTAVVVKRTRFVNNFVRLMKMEELELKANDCTALYFAAKTKIVTIAEAMVKKNNNLPSIFPNANDSIRHLPLYAAIETGNRDMVSYLYSVTPIEDLASVDRINLLKATISNDLYDTADKILDTLKLEPGEKELLWEPLEMLSRKPSEIIGNKIVEAAKVGNVEFLVILIRSYPHLIWQVDEEEYGTLFHVAIKHRQEHVFNLIYEIGVLKGILATYDAKGRKNMLQLAAELPSSDRLNTISGAALQMQRELLWFQEIESIVPKSYVNQLDKNGETPRDIFVRTHEELKKNGEKWMRNTANSCMLVATLIATVVFPAAFTVPGGNYEEKGIPIFLETNWFMVFIVSDAIAMLFSSSSILVFLSIHTSRYTEKHFLKSLPHRLALGHATLFFSITGMLIAFTAACLLIFDKKPNVPISIVVAAPAIPISLFGILHYGLWLDIFRSALLLGSNSFLFRSHKRLFKKQASYGKNDNHQLCNLTK